MAPKKGDLSAQRERKKKVIAVFGAVILVALLAIQVPRTLKVINRGSGGESPAAAAARDEENKPDVTVPVAFQSQTSAAADATPAEASRQFASFERFAAKDPFAPQIRESGKSSSKPGNARAASKKPKLKKAKKAGAGAKRLRPTGAKQAALPTSAVISIDGAREAVQVGARFPATQKLFVLVSLTPGAARIGIAEGSLVGGQETLTLERGKSITLENTASGTRYELRLISVS